MANSKIPKNVVSHGTQFSLIDIYSEQQRLNLYDQIEKRQNAFKKEEEYFLSQNQVMNSSSDRKQQKDEKKSLNHNFQKHAVLTIKKLMKMKYDAKPSLEEKIAYKMWNLFLVTDFKFKKLLVVLFGTVNLSDQKNKALFTKCGFAQILQYDYIFIRKAQQFLRQRLVETVSQEMVHQNIQNFRNIKATEQFLIYFTQLLNLIRKGPLLRMRISKKTAERIQAQIKSKRTSKQGQD